MNENKRTSQTNWSRVDAHVIQPHEYEDVPELTEDLLASGNWVRADRHELRLDADVGRGLRALGPGWQQKANAALRKFLEAC